MLYRSRIPSITFAAFCEEDFYLAFSPERVDPGNKQYKTDFIEVDKNLLPEEWKKEKY